MTSHTPQILSCALALTMTLMHGVNTSAHAQVSNSETTVIEPVPQSPPAAQPIVINNGPQRDTVSDSHYRPHVGLIVGGAAVFLLSYTPTVIAAGVISDVCASDASLGCRDASWPLYVPLVGPFIQMGYVSGSGSNTARALLAVDGIVQGAGVAMMILGASLHSGHRSRAVSMAPYVSGNSTGMVAVGRF